ncbi:MAG: LD-carboxypeptidase [candidate division Zixibacteria bacterium]
MALIKPKRLIEGATIGIIAPAGTPDRGRLKKGIRFFNARGYKTKVFPQVRKRLGYLAGDDKSRADAIHKAFADKGIDAIICARGGYGSLRLLPFIDFNIIRKNPKLFIGYSDITVLLLSIYKETGLVTFHGPMPAVEFGRRNRPFTIDYFFNPLVSTAPIGEIKRPRGYRIEKINGGTVKGRIVGGNLCLMTKLIGTRYLPPFKDKIVFFEDTEEEPYRIDGYLAQLFQTTDFGKAKGYIIGEFTRTESKYGSSSGWTVRKVISDYFSGLKKPSIYGFPCGHGKEKITIPMGIKAVLDADNKKVIFEETGVTG